MTRLREVKGKAMCPYCGQDFEINYTNVFELNRKKFSGKTIGIFFKLMCKKCNKVFPYLKIGVYKEEFDELVEIAQDLIKNKVILEKGIKNATEALTPFMDFKRAWENPTKNR